MQNISEMVEEIRTLDEDLNKKLARLCYTHDHPGYFVSEYFYDLRNSIDYDAENLLDQVRFGVDEMDSEEEQCTEDLVELRDEFMSRLKEIEAAIMSKLPARSAESGEVYASLKNKVDRFTSTSIEGSDVNECEDAYVALALEIIDETNRLEKRLLDEQTVVYITTGEKDSFGALVHLTEDFLTKEEIESDLRPKPTLKDIYEDVEKTLNKSLVVGVTRPFVMTKSLFILKWLASLREPEMLNIFIPFGYRQYYGPGFAERRFQKLRSLVSQDKFIKGHKRNFGNLSIEGLDTLENPFKCFYEGHIALSLINNRLRSLGPQLHPIAERLVELNLSENGLESLDEELLAKCVNLIYLGLVNACLPGTEYKIGFLASLVNLQRLRLTLPPGSPTDFSIFLKLKQLENLHLNGNSTMVTGENYSKLTSDDFMQLSGISKLKSLTLSYFDMETIDSGMLSGFNKLRTFSVEHSNSVQFHRDAFKNFPSKLEYIWLDDNGTTRLEADWLAGQNEAKFLALCKNKISYLHENSFRGLESLFQLNIDGNQLDDLPAGVFDSLVNVSRLILKENNIRSIKSGVFGELAKLTYLDLSHNPIEVIENDAFVHLKELTKLSLNNCQLKAINNRMFTGLTRLAILSMSQNQIESIDVVTEDSIVRKVNEIMSLQGLETVKRSLFCDLGHMYSLSLAGNQLRKLNLNVFWRLSGLDHLDLSSNMINELNQQVWPGNLLDLERLNLKQNQLVSIAKNAFSQSQLLACLDLSFNKLRHIDQEFFASFRHLSKLNLRDNCLAMTITSETFAASRLSLNAINLLNNKRVKFEEGVLERMKSLRELKSPLLAPFSVHESGLLSSPSPLRTPEHPRFNLIHLQRSNSDTLKTFLHSERNQSSLVSVQKLLMTNSSLETLDGFDLGKRFGKLTLLDLSRNQISEVKSSWFESMPFLAELNMSHNLIETLDDPALFENLHSLIKVSFKMNRLTHINRRLLHGLVALESLDLSDNQISTVDRGMFRGLIRLRTINLSNNNISYLNMPKLFEYCRSLEGLSLLNNPFDRLTIYDEAITSQDIRLKRLFAQAKASIDTLQIRNVEY